MSARRERLARKLGRKKPRRKDEEETAIAGRVLSSALNVLNCPQILWFMQGTNKSLDSEDMHA